METKIMKPKNLIKDKRGTKVLDIFLISLLGIFCFGAFFYFITSNAMEAEITIDQRYNQTWQNLTHSQSLLSDNIDETRDAIQSVTEANSAAQVAWNGLTGMLSLLKIPFKMFNVVINSFMVVADTFDFLPSPITATLKIVLTVLIVFAFIRFFTNRGNDA